jgi:glycine/D-amino acid oxidase-like deaminating enzyme
MVSFWEKQSFYAEKDIIIIGAGLAGLWAAIELFERNGGLKILVLDKGPIPTGASTRNAGFACFGSPTELLHDCDLLGEDKMWQIAEMRYQGVKKTTEYFNENLIELDRCGGYELLKKGYEGLGRLDEKIAWLNNGMKSITGLEQTFTRNDERLKEFKFRGFAGLVANPLEAGLHSGKLVQALTKKALDLGIEIMTSTEVTGWESGENNATVYTKLGIALKASKILFCTNGFTGSLVNNMAVIPARGQILVTEPLENIAFSGTFHYDEGYYYFRSLGKRVLIGGARNKAEAEETTTELETTDVIQHELERFLREHILNGKPFKVELRWSGIMGFTATKLPEVRRVAPNVFALVTCNGMGVALAPIMAEKAAAMVLG